MGIGLDRHAGGGVLNASDAGNHVFLGRRPRRTYSNHMIVLLHLRHLRLDLRAHELLSPL
jgi:hypothetical protein